jgi:hypothetical protein
VSVNTIPPTGCWDGSLWGEHSVFVLWVLLRRVDLYTLKTRRTGVRQDGMKMEMLRQSSHWISNSCISTGRWTIRVIFSSLVESLTSCIPWVISVRNDWKLCILLCGSAGQVERVFNTNMRWFWLALWNWPPPTFFEGFDQGMLTSSIGLSKSQVASRFSHWLSVMSGGSWAGRKGGFLRLFSLH